MMPSSRVEVWVTYRDQTAGSPRRRRAPPPHGGPGPHHGLRRCLAAVDLAKVQFKQTGGRQFTSSQVWSSKDSGLMQPGGMFVPGSGCACRGATSRRQRGCKAGLRGRGIAAASSSASPTWTDGTFALGYEEVDQHGKVVPGSHQPDPNNLDSLAQFDPAHHRVPAAQSRPDAGDRDLGAGSAVDREP